MWQLTNSLPKRRPTALLATEKLQVPSGLSVSIWMMAEHHISTMEPQSDAGAGGCS